MAKRMERDKAEMGVGDSLSFQLVLSRDGRLGYLPIKPSAVDTKEQYVSTL